jgi:hypothetical protein
MASRRPHSTSKSVPTPPAVEKAAAPAPAKTSGAKTTGAKRSATKTARRTEVSENMRRSMIAQAAYLRAERRGFTGGDEVEDWLAAEAEVDALLRAGSGGTAQ